MISMALTKNDLVGKKVYSPDASFVGSVVDIGLAVDVRDPALIVKINDSVSIELPWEDVGYVKDIILTKQNVDATKYKQIVETPRPAVATQPVVTPQPVVAPPPVATQQTARFCTSCGKKATWIEKYSRWYCYSCKKYL